MAGRKDDLLISTSMISKKLKIPRVFLAKIVQKMAVEGIIQSRKGKSGGIRIINPKTKLLDIIEIFEPSFHFIKCLDKKYNCFLKTSCNVRKILNGLETDFKNKLRDISLEEAAR